MDVERIYHNHLQGLRQDSICEACNNPIIAHEWADLDENGFAVNCSERVRDAQSS